MLIVADPYGLGKLNVQLLKMILEFEFWDSWPWVRGDREGKLKLRALFLGGVKGMASSLIDSLSVGDSYPSQGSASPS